MLKAPPTSTNASDQYFFLSTQQYTTGSRSVSHSVPRPPLLIPPLGRPNITPLPSLPTITGRQLVYSGNPSRHRYVTVAKHHIRAAFKQGHPDAVLVQEAKRQREIAKKAHLEPVWAKDGDLETTDEHGDPVVASRLAFFEVLCEIVTGEFREPRFCGEGRDM